ncbi:hypothetical protein SPHINGO8BC_60614 [Sphingobacterium multivorum]|uniref:Uncharacterized protein n=1 Tax=Sphingobacterium multivorum TaxID=28454 RepID=A0A654DKG2_SPHMU|nr:hypothetical protein SPHINGO8BC_60614 [Sphingobacterium multivorum]
MSSKSAGNNFEKMNLQLICFSINYLITNHLITIVLNSVKITLAMYIYFRIFMLNKQL